MISSMAYYKHYGFTDRKDGTQFSTVHVPASNTGKGSTCTVILAEEDNYYEDAGPGFITLFLVVWKSCTHSPGKIF